MSFRLIFIVALFSCAAGTQVCEEGTFISNDGKCHAPGDTTNTGLIPIGDDDDDDVVIDTDDTDTDTDVPPVLIDIDVANMYMGGNFGWDAQNHVIVPGTQAGGNVVASQFYIQLGNALFTGDWADTANYCLVWYELDGYVDQAFAQVEGFPFGFAIPQNNVVGGTTCETNEFFGDMPVWPLFQNYLLKIELGGDPSAEVQVFLDAYIPVQDHNFYIGGDFPSENFLTGGTDAIWFTANQVDQNFNISNTRLTRAQIDDGNGGIATGYYRFGFANYWVFQ